MIRIKDNPVFLYGLIILVILSRLIPHAANFTPIGALGLFAGAYLTRRSAWLIPFAALIISDLFIGFYHVYAMLFVYLGFAANILIGRQFLLQKRSILSLFSASLGSASIFFIFSNFGVWLTGIMYPMTFAGLSECFVMAIPFFGNTLLGTFVYVVVLFGLYETLQEWAGRQQKTHAV